MEVLKRKRMYEAQRDSLANQQFNIDQTAFAINTVKDTQVTVSAMKAAAKTLKTENKKIDLNDIENMQDEMEGKTVITPTLIIPRLSLPFYAHRHVGRCW